MNKMSDYIKIDLSGLALVFYCILLLFLYLRKRRITFLNLGLGALIYAVLAFTVFHTQRGYELICLSLLGILVLVGSYKELIQLEADGKTVAHMFDLDTIDFIFAVGLYLVWVLINHYFL